MKKKSLLVLGACALSLMFTACSDEMDPNDPASVRKYLTKQKIPFTPNKFISFVTPGDTASMSLFLKAAYDINSTDDNGNSAVAIAVNKGKNRRSPIFGRSWRKTRRFEQRRQNLSGRCNRTPE